jgi:two-component system cell cycle response regulator
MINFTFMGLAMLRKVGRLRDQARQDPLTGLFNRRVLDQAARAAWDRWKGGSEPFAALSLDLDFFRRVNDAHGHLAGDGLLKQVAWRLSAAVRKVDTVARTGGEEFVVLLPQVDRESALATAERLRAAIRAAPFELADGLWPMTISVGVALADPGDAGPDVVLQRADLALYRAKAAGRDRVEFLA